MVLASMDLWDIVDEYEEISLSNTHPKVLKEYQKRIKNAMSMISLNLGNNQIGYTKSYKGPMDAWKTFCNIHGT